MLRNRRQVLTMPHIQSNLRLKCKQEHRIFFTFKHVRVFVRLTRKLQFIFSIPDSIRVLIALVFWGKNVAFVGY